MIAEQKAVDEAMVEQLVTQVRGVLAVRVVVDAQKQIEEIHVVGSPGRSAKQMVRDVESILYVRGGIRLDHRKISLVQIAESVIQPSVVRVQLLDIVQAVDGHIPTVAVSLVMGDQRVQGVGRGRPDQETDLDYLVGYATIHALDQLIGPRGQLRLENLEHQPFGQLPVYLSHLTLATDDGIETLLGISAVRGDVAATVARAILDAVNRRLQRMLGEVKGAHHS
jgi:hypothetical protein